MKALLKMDEPLPDYFESRATGVRHLVYRELIFYENNTGVSIYYHKRPVIHGGNQFSSDKALQRIGVAKLLINSENDEGADDILKMYEIVNELRLFPGDAHAIALLKQN